MNPAPGKGLPAQRSKPILDGFLVYRCLTLSMSWHFKLLHYVLRKFWKVKVLRKSLPISVQWSTTLTQITNVQGKAILLVPYQGRFCSASWSHRDSSPWSALWMPRAASQISTLSWENTSGNAEIVPAADDTSINFLPPYSRCVQGLKLYDEQPSMH